MFAYIVNFTTEYLLTLYLKFPQTYFIILQIEICFDKVKDSASDVFNTKIEQITLSPYLWVINELETISCHLWPD